MAIPIQLLTDNPITMKMRKMSLEKIERSTEYLHKEVSLGLFEPTHSPWASNTTWAPKPDSFCMDYRRINAVIVRDSCPLSRLENIIQKISLERSSFSLLIWLRDSITFIFTQMIGTTRLPYTRNSWKWAVSPYNHVKQRIRAHQRTRSTLTTVRVCLKVNACLLL